MKHIRNIDKFKLKFLLFNLKLMLYQKMCFIYHEQKVHELNEQKQRRTSILNSLLRFTIV